MPSFHITSKGDPGVCKAASGNCPLGSIDNHYATAEEARKAFEQRVSSEEDIFADPLHLDTNFSQSRGSIPTPKMLNRADREVAEEREKQAEERFHFLESQYLDAKEKMKNANPRLQAITLVPLMEEQADALAALNEARRLNPKFRSEKAPMSPASLREEAEQLSFRAAFSVL